MGASLDVGNLGCRALATSLIGLFTEITHQTELFLLYGHHAGGVKTIQTAENEHAIVAVVNYRLSPRSKLQKHLLCIFLLALALRFSSICWLRKTILRKNEWLRCLYNCDFVGEINGGDSFSDIYGIRKFIIGCIPSFIAILLEKKLVLLPQTYGPYNSWIARKLALFIMSKASKVYARDKESLELVKLMLGTKTNSTRISFCPDVAFALKPFAPNRRVVDSELPAKDCALVGINVSGLLWIGGYTEKNMFDLSVDYPSLMRELILQILNNLQIEVLLVPHTFGDARESDLLACLELLSSLPSENRCRVHLVNGVCEPNEIKSIIGGCDFMIGSRMHACIAALSLCIPCVGIAYSRKFHGVFESVGVEKMNFDARTLSSSAIIAGCLMHFQRRQEIREILKRTIPRMQDALKSIVYNEWLHSTDL